MFKSVVTIALILSSTACSNLTEIEVQKEVSLSNYKSGATITIEAEEGAVCEISGCAYNDEEKKDERCMKSSETKDAKNVQTLILTKATTEKYQYFILDESTTCQKDGFGVDRIITIESRGL